MSDLVAFNGSNVPYWHSNTAVGISSGPFTLQVTNEGAVQILNNAGISLWTQPGGPASPPYTPPLVCPAGTVCTPLVSTAALVSNGISGLYSSSGQYLLVMQEPGNVVLYGTGAGGVANPSSSVIWSNSGATLTGGPFQLVMQNNGGKLSHISLYTDLPG